MRNSKSVMFFQYISSYLKMYWKSVFLLQMKIYQDLVLALIIADLAWDESVIGVVTVT